MAEVASVLIPQIHHEKQESGSMLCAQHALNALLQGNYYDPSQLSDIAQQLDQLEQSQVDAATWQARGNDAASLNMDDTGYFSVSVLETALEVWGLRLARWRSEEMQPLQDKPEQQLAFVLNLESHWFTIRSFVGEYWFNLNSFLDKPSWVGPSYLGALLSAAETEGYSVFAVRASADHAIGNFRSSAADECAAILPPASAQSNGASSNSTSHGLRPSLSKASSSSTPPLQDNDEDADIQAALQASLAHAAISSGSNEEQSTSSRMQSPTIAGQRRSRMGPAHGNDSMDDQEETDAHVDAIAPSRRRARGSGPLPTSAMASSSRSAPYVLPAASGGRRRASRQQIVDDDDVDPVRPGRAARGSGGSRENAISVDDDSLEIGEGRTNTAISIDDDDDYAALGATASSAPRSPFLNPALRNVNAGSSSNSDDDFHSVSDGEGDLGESMMQHDIDAVRRHASMRPNRDYDDEDAELQAALAASMQADQAAEGGTAERQDGAQDDLAAADWLNEEDLRAIREAQANFGAAAPTSMSRARSTSSRSSPPPADVARIARMRAEAQRKIVEEQEAESRGSDAIATNGLDTDSGNSDHKHGSDSDDDSSDDEQPQMSIEEVRRARLARFGG